ncbi:single-stranded DNA-binding protein [Streptomyces sp. NPDC059017]|uniref:single-stranded DNA-binding protein n=1 Tax=Streptomyces sp. NPDC059017 TaxID=3346700 RepID=UPI00367C514F
MIEQRGPAFDGEAVAKALGTKPQEVTDPAYGDGQHFQVQTDKNYLSLDTFPQSGVSRITTKGARIELFGGVLPRVEDEGIVFLQKDSEHEHSTVSLHPDGGLTFGYQVDAGPAAASLPDDSQDTQQIITRHEAVQAPAEESLPKIPDVASTPKPPEKPGRTPGAFPDERPVIQRVDSPEPEATTPEETVDVPQTEPSETARQDEHPLERAARIRAKDQAAQESAEGEAKRIKLTGRLGRTPTFRRTANGKYVGKFPLAVHMETGETVWRDVLAFGDRASALEQRVEGGQLGKGHEVEVVGYPHTREYKGRDGTPKTAQEIYLVAVTRR